MAFSHVYLKHHLKIHKHHDAAVKHFAAILLFISSNREIDKNKLGLSKWDLEVIETLENDDEYDLNTMEHPVLGSYFSKRKSPDHLKRVEDMYYQKRARAKKRAKDKKLSEKGK